MFWLVHFFKRLRLILYPRHLFQIHNPMSAPDTAAAAASKEEDKTVGFNVYGFVGAGNILSPVIDLEIGKDKTTLKGAEQIKARFTKAEMNKDESELWIFDSASKLSVGIPKGDFAFNLLRHVYGL